MSIFKQKSAFKDEHIKIDTTSVYSVATTMATAQEEMRQAVDNMYSAIGELEGNWDSSVYEDFVTRVSKTKEVYEEIDNIMIGISNFLSSVAQTYEENERNTAAGDKSKYKNRIGALDSFQNTAGGGGGFR